MQWSAIALIAGTTRYRDVRWLLPVRQLSGQAVEAAATGRRPQHHAATLGRCTNVRSGGQVAR
jgi:hypothetical protein